MGLVWELSMKLDVSLKSKIFLVIFGLSAILLFRQQSATAQQTAPLSCRNEITDRTISQTGLTEPSFWWAEERFGGQLLDSWLVCRNERRLDLIVDRQIWTLLDYLERYEFVNHFGAIARGYGYSVRVLNTQQTPLASYSCNFQVTPTACNLWIDTLGREGYRRPPVP